MTTAKTVTELFTELMAIFKDELSCEIFGHGHTHLHPNAEEPGEWYITSKCRTCEHSSTKLACNTFRNNLIKIGPNAKDECLKCGAEIISGEFITSMVHR